MSTIHFIFTGGTIDSYYDVTKDTAVPYVHSVIPQYLASLKLYTPFRFSRICMKDSRDIGMNDRKKMLRAIEKSTCSKILLTHGTYTMPKTAQFLHQHLRRRDQTIILTGSMIPLMGFSPSDAGFSLGFALAKIQQLPPGVYVAMNGRAFTPGEVKKNIRKGRFES
ncbi:asparaginase [Candidatus Peregrinibacteria bacterium]|nr:asparaginase [Candidatus Peregrinibacteria bacterium]